jgi:hypothetical protein
VAGKAGRGRIDPHEGVAPAAEPDGQPHIRTVVRHREHPGLAVARRWSLQTVTASPREADQDVGRIIELGSGVGAVPQRDSAPPHLAGVTAGTPPAVVEEDRRVGAGDAEAPGAVAQEAPRVGLETALRLRQRHPASTTGEKDERADQRDPHGRTISSVRVGLRRLTVSNRIVMPARRSATSVVTCPGEPGAIELGPGS